MIYSIDYYSYTIPTERPFTEGMFYDDRDSVINTFRTSIPSEEFRDKLDDEWEHESGGRFYQHRLRHGATDIALSYGKTNSHVFIEFDGKACNVLEASDVLLPIIHNTFARCSRVDFAVDIECQTPPSEFIASRDNRSFKSSGNKYSPSGGTEYIGGRTSERMARVYRYYQPHPRSHLLRVEAEYKGDAAKAAAEYLSAHSIQETCLSAHSVFKWRHSEWQPETPAAPKITFRAYMPNDANTVRWLYGDVITALRKAIKGDLIDFEEWLKTLQKGLF